MDNNNTKMNNKVFEQFITSSLNGEKGAFILIKDSAQIITSVVHQIEIQEISDKFVFDDTQVLLYVENDIRPSGANLIKRDIEKELGIKLIKIMCIFVKSDSSTRNVMNKFSKILSSSAVQIGRA